MTEKKDSGPGGYIGFVAGVFSGIAKNTVGHPFDTIKVRLQTDSTQFKGPIDCCIKTLKTQGPKGFFLGFTPPLWGWIVMDSCMLGSLHNYRRIIKKNLYHGEDLDLKGHMFAGVLAGWTVSFIAAPVELVKVKLQVQYGAKNAGPLVMFKKIINERGFGVNGLYKGLLSTLIFRTNFIVWWGSYFTFTKFFKQNTNLSDIAINFWSGGLSASCFWISAYPSDVVKSYLLANDKFKGSLSSWKDAAKEIYQTRGPRGFVKGFVPSILRSFPANAAALAAFEAVLRLTGAST